MEYIFLIFFTVILCWFTYRLGQHSVLDNIESIDFPYVFKIEDYNGSLIARDLMDDTFIAQDVDRDILVKKIQEKYPFLIFMSVLVQKI